MQESGDWPFWSPAHSEGTGCEANVLSSIRRTVLWLASAELPVTAFAAPCTYSAGAAASGIAFSASSSAIGEARCMFQVWSGRPLCSGVSSEPVFSVCPAFS